MAIEPVKPLTSRAGHVGKRVVSTLTRLVCAIAAMVPLLALNHPAVASAAPFSPLQLQNGWTNSGYTARPASVTNLLGIVSFQGAIANGTSPVAFTLAPEFRPSVDLFVPVDLCNTHNGRLHIQTDGVVIIQTRGTFSDAQCFTSLDGASYALDATGYTALPPQNGWQTYPGTRTPAAKTIGGVVHLEGAMHTNDLNPVPFTLPAAFWPSTSVDVPVDLCNAHHGHIWISSNGEVTVAAGPPNHQSFPVFADAQCFTSLEGASYALDATGYTALPPQNGWTAVAGIREPAVEDIGGIVHFQGGVNLDIRYTNPVLFTLPAALRPPADAYVPIDLCRANNGRLHISPDGTVSVDAEEMFSDAQCFTSLEGASFVLTTFSPLGLQNGWINDAYGRPAAVTNVSGIITFQGTIKAQTNSPVPFTLPPAFRPSANVYVPIDLCAAHHGRLYIRTDGVVTVQAESDFEYNHAYCLTSLEGVAFAQDTSNSVSLTPLNGWITAPYGNRAPAASNINGIVHLQGAISNGTNPVAFTLPWAFWPSDDVYLQVDLCGAGSGRLHIKPYGTVIVESENGFSVAQCFTSLEGASYARDPYSATALTAQNGWATTIRTPAVQDIGGIVHFQGGIANGTTPEAFTLPPAFRPTAEVFVSVDLCGSHHGALMIEPDGAVTIQGQFGWFDAKCFTSLEGASFAL